MFLVLKRMKIILIYVLDCEEWKKQYFIGMENFNLNIWFLQNYSVLVDFNNIISYCKVLNWQLATYHMLIKDSHYVRLNKAPKWKPRKRFVYQRLLDSYFWFT